LRDDTRGSTTRRNGRLSRGKTTNYYRALAVVVLPVLRTLAEVGADASDQVHLTRAFRSALHGFVVLERAGGFEMPATGDEGFRCMTDLLIAAVREVSRSRET